MGGPGSGKARVKEEKPIIPPSPYVCCTEWATEGLACPQHQDQGEVDIDALRMVRGWIQPTARKDRPMWSHGSF